MEKLIIEELNKLSKWVITKNISFIGHEWSNSPSLFTFIKIGDVNIHLEIFFDGVNIESIVNCFRDKEHLLSFSGKTEDCLTEVDSIKFQLNIFTRTCIGCRYCEPFIYPKERKKELKCWAKGLTTITNINEICDNWKPK